MAKPRRDGRNEWDVEREAGEEFKRLNPPPEKAPRTEKIDPLPAGLVQHLGQGGIWLILSERGHRSDQPVTEMTIVLGPAAGKSTQAGEDRPHARRVGAAPGTGRYLADPE